MIEPLIIILLFILFFAFVFIVAIGLFVFWIMMLIDCAKRSFKGENEKVIWILVIVLVSWLGALIYYFVVKKQDKIVKRK